MAISQPLDRYPSVPGGESVFGRVVGSVVVVLSWMVLVEADVEMVVENVVDSEVESDVVLL